MANIYTYVLQVWRGKQPLAVIFWTVFFAPLLFFIVLSRSLTERSSTLALVTFAYFTFASVAAWRASYGSKNKIAASLARMFILFCWGWTAVRIYFLAKQGLLF